MIKVIYKQLGIAGIVTACRIEKNISAAGSEAEITAICSPGDRYLPAINPACGDPVTLVGDDGELFSGNIERLAFSADQLTVTMLCYDKATLLAKNEIYMTLHGSPSDVARKAASAAGLTIADAWQKPGSVFIPASCALSAHQIIRQAYGGECVTECDGGKLNILEPGARRASADKTKLLSAWARHSADGMVNSAEVIGYMGRSEATAQNEDDIKTYGERKRVFSLSGARAGAGTQASTQLCGMKREAGIKLFGVAPIKCGDLLSFDAPEYGISGEWTVTMVTHEISGGFSSTSVGMVK